MTTSSINTATTTPASKPIKINAPRSVTFTKAEAHDGRLPVTVTAVPLEDLDAKGGVFVDFRLGAKAPEGVDPSAPSEELAPKAGSIQEGDKAIAAMVTSEAAAESAAQASPGTAPAEAPKKDGKDTKRFDARQPVVSHQIAQAMKLTVGQAETFRADVALPGVAAEGLVWYARGRFATLGGKDLSSAWTRV